MSQNNKSDPSEKTLGNSISRFLSAFFKKLAKWASDFKNWIARPFTKTKNISPQSSSLPLSPIVVAPLKINSITPRTPSTPSVSSTPFSLFAPPSSQTDIQLKNKIEAKAKHWQARLAAHKYVNLGRSVATLIYFMKEGLIILEKGKPKSESLKIAFESFEKRLEANEPLNTKEIMEYAKKLQVALTPYEKELTPELKNKIKGRGTHWEARLAAHKYVNVGRSVVTLIYLMQEALIILEKGKPGTESLKIAFESFEKRLEADEPLNTKEIMGYAKQLSTALIPYQPNLIPPKNLPKLRL